ncbi:MAG: rod shape-determining protein MreD [Trueperaceae bacterium]|nr:rod shape-determining protein MreD [Truepera sp.]HRN19049.1 rod shape-determining protein MreD [Trueperaceae bacterium]HRQ10446.1 rod shape-determining protein MreD [Trueperaceae bacterium]
MRLVLFYLILIVAQGFFAALLAPIPAPDFFLLAVLTLLWRIQPWQLVLVAYGVGLLQDVIGSGVLGTHAFALAAAALAGSMVRAQLSNAGVLERMLVVFVASMGKWVVMAGVVFWLSGSVGRWGAVGGVALVESVLTVAAGLLVLPWGSALLERSRVLQKELL